MEHSISIVLPTINEALNLSQLLPRIEQVLSHRRYEIVVVDDGSTDDTVASCVRWKIKIPLTLIRRSRPAGGLSGAVLTGIAHSQGDIVVVMDADLQHPPEAIPQVILPIEESQADFSIGSRFLSGARVDRRWTLWRRFNARLGRIAVAPLAPGIRDPLSGYFAFRQGCMKSASSLSPVGYKIGLELMCKCRPMRIAEVPIVFGRRSQGQSKLNVRQRIIFLRHLARLYRYEVGRRVRSRVLMGAVQGDALTA